MRQIRKLIIHCSASDNPLHDNIRTVREWHLLRNFDDVGYHFFIRHDGTMELGREISVMGAHCQAQGMNHDTIGICLSGNRGFTGEQFATLRKLCRNLCAAFKLNVDDIEGHNKYEKGKTCPNFNMDLFKEYFNGKRNQGN